MRSLSRDEVRKIDGCAIRSVGVPGVVLMENAGRNAADWIERFMGGAVGKAVAIVAGAGNNGGDGFVVARHLAMRAAKVVTFLAADPEGISGEARVNLDIIRSLGHDVREIAAQGLSGLSVDLKDFDLVVDAVGGTGIRGPLRDDLAAVVEQINAAGRPVVAIDIPTGLDCDTGQASGPVVRADMTVTFLAAKKGFEAPGASAYTGPVHVVDIGVPADQVAKAALGEG